MSSTPIYIHEFSTGIEAERTADGGWVSRGFTGHYINRTIDPIPRAVQEAITNREFAVAEGASSDEPTVIGREVGYGEEWSVVAVVTRGRDDRGRSASVYRYFLCEGKGHLAKILAWMNALRQAGQSYVFDPFEAQTVGHPHEYTGSESDVALRDELKDLLNAPPPIIIPSDSPCAPLLINKMAQTIAGDRLIAWGYKVEALEEPRGFQIIQPASSRAEELLRKAIASKPNTPAPIAGEKTLISAINGLIRRDRIKPEQLETIETALTNPQIDDSYWETIFRGRGADKALKQGIYTADMVRLLTLRAMVIPETLPEFLAWMGKGGKQKDIYEVSEKFQEEVKKFLSQAGQAPNLQTQVYQGVKLIIPKLIEQPEILEAVVWLLGTKSGIWRLFYERKLRKEFNSDLASIGRYFRQKKEDISFNLDNQEWEKLFNELQAYWKFRSLPKQQKYQPLANLLAHLGDYKLSAFFYHVSSGVVPKEVFFKLASQGFYYQVYGIRVQREIGNLELLWLKTLEIGGQIVPVALVVPLVIATLLLGFADGKFTADKSKTNSNEENASTAYSEKNETTRTKYEKSANSSEKNEEQSAGTQEDYEGDIPEKVIEEALEKFNETSESLVNIINQNNSTSTTTSETETPNQQQEVVDSLQEILDKNNKFNLNLSNLVNTSEEDPFKKEEKEALIKAVYTYQNNKSELKNSADGVISNAQATADELKKDLKNKLKKTE